MSCGLCTFKSSWQKTHAEQPVPPYQVRSEGPSVLASEASPAICCLLCCDSPPETWTPRVGFSGYYTCHTCCCVQNLYVHVLLVDTKVGFAIVSTALDHDYVRICSRVVLFFSSKQTLNSLSVINYSSISLP